ncbi:hypothetical protein ACFE04_025046 [Oxalis oulophora]
MVSGDGDGGKDMWTEVETVSSVWTGKERGKSSHGRVGRLWTVVARFGGVGLCVDGGGDGDSLVDREGGDDDSLVNREGGGGSFRWMRVIRATGRLSRGKGRDWSVEEDGWAEREQLLVTAAGQRGWAEKKGTAEHDCAGEVTTEKARVVVGGLGRTSRDWAGVFVVGQRAVCDRNGNGWKVDRNGR